MRRLYCENDANFPRLFTDRFFVDYENEYKYDGFVDEAFGFVMENQLMRTDLWERFVKQFREDDADFDRGWRCEYWGKMMRGASFVLSYSKDKELMKILKDTVEDMMACADETGRISTYSVDHELDGWDLWGRKYVLLGMQYFSEVCDDKELVCAMIDSMSKQVDYIIERIGHGEGKKEITSATRNWRGLNSSSILEPVVRLYSLTKNQKYLDFAEYIVSTGATDVVNIFELAYENDFCPYQYPVTKAYEMISCFEGLLEYYRIAKNEKHKRALINFAERILETDFTVIGSSGCTEELFDHSTVRQANTTNTRIMQETCVTVTVMKFMYQMHLLTGDAKYVDAFERAFYNAYLGSFNTEHVIEKTIKTEYPDCIAEPLPFDSYSPLCAGTRGNGIGGLRIMSDKHYYGCCACIGSAGIGLVPKMQLLSYEKGFVMNLFINGRADSKTPLGNKVSFFTNTDYPVGENVKITVSLASPEKFAMLIRNPEWNKKTEICVCGERIEAGVGYTLIERQWCDGDSIEIKMDMRTEAIYPVPYGSEMLMNKVVWGYNYMIQTFDREDPKAKHHVALRRGPIMLAQEARLGYSLDTPIGIAVGKDGYIDVIPEDKKSVPYKSLVAVGVPLCDGTRMLVTDYSSAGKLWTDESKTAVWMLTKD